MNRKHTAKIALLLCVAVIASMMVFAGCGSKPESGKLELPVADGAVVGEGKTSFKFLIVDLEGKEVHVTVNTDKTIVGEALQEAGLIEGEEGEYGLFVKSVNGTKLDYDADGAYWAFYIGADYASVGVDSAEIAADVEYAFKAEKAEAMG